LGCDDSRQNERSRVAYATLPLEMTLAPMPDRTISKSADPGDDQYLAAGSSASAKSASPAAEQDNHGPINENGRKLGNEPIDGDRLVGSYWCEFQAKDLPLGPFKLNRFGCRVIKDRDGVLRLRSSSGIASLKGTLTNLGATGFFINGNYKFPGNRLHFKTGMKESISKKVKYEGTGLGIMNEDRRDKKLFSFIMIKEYK
jgi:hypothetical protein